MAKDTKEVEEDEQETSEEDSLETPSDAGITKMPADRVEESVDASGEDIFDDAFGEDDETKESRKKLKERAKELMEDLEKKKAKELSKIEDKVAEETENSEDEAEKEPIEEEIENSKNDAEEEAGETPEEPPQNDSENEVGGKVDMRVIQEEEPEEEEKPREKLHPIERKIIKSVIKNKAKQSSKNEIEENAEKAEEEILKEDGITESGVLEADEDEVEFEEELDEMAESSTGIKPNLEFLMSDEGNAFIGRKRSVLKKYGEEAGLFIGRVEEEDLRNTGVCLDGLHPHVVFACGARGTGKSYVLGVIAEELALKNKNVGIVAVDPVGVFWSMRHPNRDEKELELLAQWGIMPKGVQNVKVFIPVGMKNTVPSSTYDSVFSIQPALLTVEDWCLTFGIDRFSPTGLLMEKGIAKMKSGYTNLKGEKIRGKENTFSLEDLIVCFETDSEVNNRERGYKTDSIRALVSRFDAAKHWGVLDEKGTPLGILSRSGQLTILDISFLEENVGALVVGILARRLLSARKLSTRREAAGKFSDAVEDLVEVGIPPTWLLIDEAHTLIPGGNVKTPASNALIEYVKQGRRPGCSLVFATQQPSAIDPRVLSQLDIMMAHKLVFDDDIKSITKRTPAIIPPAYKKPNFIKTMPLGVALVGDRQETTSRAFIMKIRPRMSQHEGRDAETVQLKQEIKKDQLENLAVNLILRQLEKDPKIPVENLEQAVDSLNHTYEKDMKAETILEKLKKKGIIAKDGYLAQESLLKEGIAEKIKTGKEIAGAKTPAKMSEEKDEETEFEEKVELISLQPEIDEANARKTLAKHMLRKKLGLFGEEEILDRLSLKYVAIYKVKYNYFSQKNAFQSRDTYIDSLTGEFIHDVNGKIRESKGLSKLKDLREGETTVLKLLGTAKNKATIGEIASATKMEEGNVGKIMEVLLEKELVNVSKASDREFYSLNAKEIDLPQNPLHEILDSIGKRPITEIESAAAIQPAIAQKDVQDLLKKLWGNITVREITELYLPVWEGVMKKRTGEERIERIDAINGNRLIFS
ncbi:MAG: ATP-binding protein [archaeon]